MSQNQPISVLKLGAMFVFAWAAMVAIMHFILWMSADCCFDLRFDLKLLPVTALLCLFPTAYMVLDYVRVHKRQ